MAADNDPNCEWSWLDKRHPSTNVDDETEEDDDDLEVGWPMAEAIKEAINVAAMDSAYRGWCHLRGQEARML